LRELVGRLSQGPGLDFALGRQRRSCRAGEALGWQWRRVNYGL